MLAGAGVAVQAGFPTWAELLDELGEELKPTRTPEELSVLKSQRDNLWRAEEYRLRLGESAYFEFLRRRFAPTDRPVPADLLTLAKLNWKHVFTTNYDLTLERAYESAYPKNANKLDWGNRDEVRAFLGRLDEGRYRYFIHIHGRFDKPEEIVLTYRDYVRRYIRNGRDGAQALRFIQSPRDSFLSVFPLRILTLLTSFDR